jgi:predicted Zn-dependent protease
VSERPNLPWSFKVVDHELINAFALPGGFIYVTRGILAHMNSEAELAAVLGHEAGHVTARHTAQQITRQQLGALGLIGAAIFSEGVRENADLAMLGMQLALLRYGREAEREADALGFRYMTRTGHHPDGLTRIMHTLDSTTPSSSELGIPSWLLSHPDPGDRVEANERRIAEAGDGLRGHELRVADFLGMLDGLVFGEDPRNGLVLDERFVHPTLRFELTFPAGWAVANGPQAVQGSSPGQDAILELTLAPEESPAAALQAFSGMEGVTVVDAGSGRLNGLDARTARFTVDTQGQQLAGRVVFVAHRGHVYRLLGYALREDWQRHSPGVDRAIGTFEPLPAGEYEDVRPHRMRIVTLDRAMTGDEFVRTYPSTVPAEDVLLANQVTPAETLPRGRLMKQIVGGRIPTH